MNQVLQVSVNQPDTAVSHILFSTQCTQHIARLQGSRCAINTGQVGKVGIWENSPGWTRGQCHILHGHQHTFSLYGKGVNQLKAEQLGKSCLLLHSESWGWHTLGRHSLPHFSPHFATDWSSPSERCSQQNTFHNRNQDGKHFIFLNFLLRYVKTLHYLDQHVT